MRRLSSSLSITKRMTKVERARAQLFVDILGCADLRIIAARGKQHLSSLKEALIYSNAQNSILHDGAFPF
jgi:hypothetical protein